MKYIIIFLTLSAIGCVEGNIQTPYNMCRQACLDRDTVICEVNCENNTTYCICSNTAKECIK